MLIVNVAQANPVQGSQVANNQEIAELDPFAADIESQLEELDAAYEQATGQSAFLDMPVSGLLDKGCYRKSCTVYLDISKSQQVAYLYLNGLLIGEYAVSTGVAGRGTPNFDKHPNGRVYSGRYSSKKYPGGNYVDPAGNLLGNMPYAVFIEGGFAVHGTPQGNWSKLGRPASHGCIRMHPDNALIFNRLVQEHGIYNVWMTVRN